MRRRRPADGAQDQRRLVVVPVVKHLHDLIGIADRQGVLEEITGLQDYAGRGWSVLQTRRPIDSTRPSGRQGH